MDNDFEIVSDDKATNSFQVDNISSILDCIRPECKTTRIIERVKNLLKVVPVLHVKEYSMHLFMIYEKKYYMQEWI